MTSTTVKSSRRTPGTLTGPVRALLALPAFTLAGYLVWLAFTNICYPLRPELGLPGYTRDSWGGPTYAGVWAVHGAAGVAMLVVAFFTVRPVVRRRSP
ncbi:hypothetical protein ABH926_004939 [Catenulispora sp. GP43]|uniref:hypothetical protein n=1 Tax=Catenulispora sp. GP43 TaxID=3156263 RepID=UPI0035185293